MFKGAFAGVVVILFLLCGCAQNHPPQAPPVLPPPSSVAIEMSITINLPAKVVEDTGLPPKLVGTLNASAHSEAISASPLRSSHEGHMTLLITDPQATQPLVDVNINVSGESEGSPTQGLGKVLERFFNAGSLLTSPIPSLDRPSQ